MMEIAQKTVFENYGSNFVCINFPNFQLNISFRIGVGYSKNVNTETVINIINVFQQKNIGNSLTL